MKKSKWETLKSPIGKLYYNTEEDSVCDGNKECIFYCYEDKLDLIKNAKTIDELGAVMELEFHKIGGALTKREVLKYVAPSKMYKTDIVSEEDENGNVWMTYLKYDDIELDLRDVLKNLTKLEALKHVLVEDNKDTINLIEKTDSYFVENILEILDETKLEEYIGDCAKGVCKVDGVWYVYRDTDYDKYIL